MIELIAARRMVLGLATTRRLVIGLAVSTAALVVAAIGNRLHFYAPECSGWLGAI